MALELDPEIESLTIDAEYRRDFWRLPGPQDRPHSLCVLLDGEHYLRDLKVVPILRDLQTCGAIPPTTFLFVSHVGAVERHADYLCDDRYSRFIARDVVGWAREKIPNLRENGHLIGGLSLSGLAAAYLALRHSETFDAALCQSGSFWWLEDHSVELPATNARFWMSVGDEETATDVSHPPSGLFQRVSQIEGVHRAAARFEALGATVNLNVYRGSHAAAPWREEFAGALEWLLAPFDKTIRSLNKHKTIS